MIAPDVETYLGRYKLAPNEDIVTTVYDETQGLDANYQEATRLLDAFNSNIILPNPLDRYWMSIWKARFEGMRIVSARDANSKRINGFTLIGQYHSPTVS